MSCLFIVKLSKNFYVQIAFIVVITISFIECFLFRNVINKLQGMLTKCRDKLKDKYYGQTMLQNLLLSISRINKNTQIKRWWMWHKCMIKYNFNYQKHLIKQKENLWLQWIQYFLKNNLCFFSYNFLTIYTQKINQ